MSLDGSKALPRTTMLEIPWEDAHEALDGPVCVP